MSRLKIVLADSNSSSCRILEKQINETDKFILTITDNKKEAVKLVKNIHPDIIIVAVMAVDEKWFKWLIKIKKKNNLILLIGDADMERRFPREVLDCISGIFQRPLVEEVSKLLLLQALQTIDLQRKLKKKTEKIQKIRKSYNELIETERFVAVRQIVENISSFIGQLANDVEGGVRYFNEIPYFVSIHNRNKKIVMANSAYKKHFGNIVNQESWKIYRGEASDPDKCPVGRTISSGSIQKINTEVAYRSGTRIPVIVHTSPIFNNNGEIELILEVSTGVKEVLKLKRELKTTQQRYQQLFDEVPCYVAVLNRNFQITAQNRKFSDVFGDEKGNSFFDVLKQRDNLLSSCPVHKTLEDAKPHQSEMVFSDRQENNFRTMMWTSPILTPAKKLTQILVILVDITNLRQLENNLSSLGLMLSSITHGIKGILTGLDAGIYMVDSGFYKNKPGKIEEGLDVAKLMAERIKKIIHDILYYSKERELNLRNISAYQFACDVASLVKPKIKSADIEFIADFDLAENIVAIDEGVLCSALVNIIENALEACIEDKTDRRFVITFRYYRENKNIVFEFSDNGPGIDKKSLANIFTIFYSTKGANGTGLGLYITEKVVRQHNGSINVFSEPYKKTIFLIKIPIDKTYQPVVSL